MVIKRSIVIDKDKEENTKSITKKKTIKKEATITKGVVKDKAIIQPLGKMAELRKLREFRKDGKILVIVESPAKSKTIEKFLGPNYVVKASMGHLRDLPKTQLGIDIDGGFIPKYNNLVTRKSLIEELRSYADDSSAVLLATDPDREGEAISWHLAYILNLDERSNCRITFNEITKTAVAEALEHPRTIDMNMVDAQQARRILDRLVGYKISPLLWKKVCKGLSAGRVQSVAVRLICEREREIQAFVPVEYWTVEGLYKTDNKEKFEVEVTHYKGEKLDVSDESSAKVIQAALENGKAQVLSVEKRKRSRKAQPPFTTSTLQQDGVRKLGFGAKRTMMIAQHLYEGKEVGSYGHVGLITYMRTDSTRISKEMALAAKTYIVNNYGAEYYPSKPNIYGTKASAQDAHEAIRPTSLELTPKLVEPFLNRDELKLYTLIWNRFIASQMAAQQAETMTVQMACGDYTLKTSGSKMTFSGYSKVYESLKKEDDKQVPLLTKGDWVKNISITPNQHFTQPPARYSEASLIKTLEEKGIGRPSTYAPIIDTIMSRNYVEKQDKQFIPTELGFVVLDFLLEHFEAIINTSFTANLESDLDKVAQGKEGYVDVLKDFYSVFSKELEEANQVDKIKVTYEESGETCELCGHPMIYRFGRYGRFLACSNFPECKNTKAITVDTGIVCPKCHEGNIVERKSHRGRVFYGCERYPACDFTVWEKPINEFCTTCGSIMTEKTYKNGTTKKFCSNLECPSRPKRKARKSKKENTSSIEKTSDSANGITPNEKDSI